MEPRITQENLKSLPPNHIFVFGSNYAGRHGRGAAKTAVQKFGAKYGQGVGLMGQSYGIATKGRKLEVLTLDQINVQVQRFTRFAEANPQLTFHVTQLGCGLAGFKPKQIAPFFVYVAKLPNVYLPKSFVDILNPQKVK